MKKHADPHSAILDAQDRVAVATPRLIPAQVIGSSPFTIRLDTGQEIPNPTGATGQTVGTRGAAFSIQGGHDWVWFPEGAPNLELGTRLLAFPVQKGHDWAVFAEGPPPPTGSG